MSTDPAQLARILAALDPLPVTAKRMFGEYAIYLDGRLPAFITDGVLGVKVTSVADPALTPDLLGPIYAGSKDYWRIPDRLLADTAWLQELVMATTAVIDPPKPRRPPSER
ncbi:MAG: TfoX/Sxy family protein [Microbacteriaceae bacterium]|nr:TfoX/Sxy family protein [Microbacteriaceae bacterium]